MYTIGQIAQRAGVTKETIRYYEREGLVEEPPRRKSGYRQYSDEAIERIKFIKRIQELGFSLKEVKQILTMVENDTDSCTNLSQLTRQKMAAIQEKIEHLEKSKAVLKKMTQACTGRDTLKACPILVYMQSAQ